MIKENKIMNKKILKIKNNDVNNRKMNYMKKIGENFKTRALRDSFSFGLVLT